MALGAHPRDIFLLVVGQGMRLTVTGLVLGVVAALSAGSLLTSLLFGVRQTDPLAFLAVSAALLSAAVLPSYLPARRAMRLDHVRPPRRIARDLRFCLRLEIPFRDTFLGLLRDFARSLLRPWSVAPLILAGSTCMVRHSHLWAPPRPRCSSRFLRWSS